MRIRLGYACMCRTLNNITTSTNYTLTSFNKEHDYDKLNKIILSNLEALEKIIDYNIKNNIHFYRLSSKIFPLSTIKNINIEYERYKDTCQRIGKKICKNNMRVDLHPDQFCVINSTNPNVVSNSFEIIKYHHKLLDILGLTNKTIILHIGSSAGGKKASITRFINNFNKLNSELKESIIIENDDKVFDIGDCINISQKTNLKIVLDYHHHLCNNNDTNIDHYLPTILSTWKNVTPKMHFSSPKNNTKKDKRTHNEYINSDDFIDFIERIKKYNCDIDIMLEAKGKDEALFRLVRELKYKTNYKFIDETSFII